MSRGITAEEAIVVGMFLEVLFYGMSEYKFGGGAISTTASRDLHCYMCIFPTHSVIQAWRACGAQRLLRSKMVAGRRCDHYGYNPNPGQ